MPGWPLKEENVLWNLWFCIVVLTFLKILLFDHASCKEKKVKQIINATIDYVCLSVSQVDVIGEYFIPFIYYTEIESPIYLAQ